MCPEANRNKEIAQDTEPLSSSLLFLLFNPFPFLKLLPAFSPQPASSLAFHLFSRTFLDSSTCAQRHRPENELDALGGACSCGKSVASPDPAWSRAALPSTSELRRARTAPRASSGRPWKADSQGHSGGTDSLGEQAVP